MNPRQFIPLFIAAMAVPLAITVEPLLRSFAAGAQSLFELSGRPLPAAEPPRSARATSTHPIPHTIGEFVCLELRLEGSDTIRVASVRTITAPRWPGFRVDSAAEP